MVLAKLGFDSHYRGAMVVARHLALQGVEVIYIGNQSPDGVLRAVVQEDPDVLGISSLSGNHMTLVPPILAGLRDEGLDEVTVVLGGVVPRADERRLIEAGVSRVFGSGASLNDIAAYILGAGSRRQGGTVAPK